MDPTVGATDPDRPARGWSPWRLWPVGILGVGLATALALGLDEYLSIDAIRDNRHELFAWRDRHYESAVAGFIGAYAMLVALSVPGAVWMTILGGFLFGTVAATVFVVLGATAGALVLFLAARHAFADAVRARAGPRIERMGAGFRHNAFSYLLALRLVPLFPFWLVNLAAASLGVPFKTFVVATAVGIIPGAFVYASLGNGLGAILDAGGDPDLGVIFSPMVLLPLLGLAALAVAPIVYKAIQTRRGHG